MNNIFHICPAADWSAALEKGSYTVPSLATEGFIHCSKPEQILEVANRYFQGMGGLVLLWIDPAKLAVELRYEVSNGDVYPHLYGPLNLAAVTRVTEFLPDLDGYFRSFPTIPANNI